MATIRTAGSDPAERQREIERDVLTPPRWPDPEGETDLSAFLARLAGLVAREQAAGSGPGRRGPMPGHLLPLLSLDPALLALDAAREAIGVLDLPAHEPSFNRIAGRIGSAACRRRHRLQGTADKGGTSSGLSDLEAILPRRRGKRRRKDLARDRRRIGDFHDLPSDSREWKQLGDLLLALATEARIVRLHRPSRGGRLVALTPEFGRALEIEPDPAVRALLCRPTDLPMLHPPAPWTGVRGGGWLLAAEEPDSATSRHHLVKHHRHGPRVALLDERASAGGLDAVLAAVNALQATPWKINRTVLDAQRLLLEIGAPGFPGILSALQLEDMRRRVEPSVGHPGLPDPEDLDLDSEDIEEDPSGPASDGELERYLAERTRRDQAMLAVSRATMLVARMDRAGAGSCFLPVQLDFRGRAYAQPALAPQDRDSVRALFQFADGKPLDPAGERWLAIHLASRFGERLEASRRRLSREERVIWTREHDGQILQLASIRAEDGVLDRDAAREILHESHPCGSWWRLARQPWQFLAACFEWADRDRPGFRTCLPVMLDGTANGLQHISALCRDPVGAAATNVIPDSATARPRDCYQEITDTVSSRISEAKAPFLAGGKPMDPRHLSPWKGHVDRALAKRIAMTIPYGVTTWTTRKAVEAAFDALPEEVRSGFPSRNQATTQLNRLVWSAALETAPSAQALLGWLQAVASALAAANLGVEWTSPSGFPVLVEYLDHGTPAGRRTETAMADGTVVHGIWSVSDRAPIRIVSKRQRRGIAAHVVHSLDAAFLVAVTNRLAGAGVQAVFTVHDAFGVHAGNADLLQDVLREEFHRMHREPWLRSLIAAQIDRVNHLVGSAGAHGSGLRLPNGLPASRKTLKRASSLLGGLGASLPIARSPFDPNLILDADHLFD